MKIKIVLALLFLSPLTAFAYTGDYCVVGAGTSAVDGTYTQTAANVWNKCPYVLFNPGAGGGSIVDVCTSDTIGTGYAELRQGASLGYYYDSAAGAGNVEDLNFVNGDGTAPVPSVTQGACPGPPPPPATAFELALAAATSTFSGTTGIDIGQVIAWSGDNIIKLFIGSGVAILYLMRGWIVALIIIGLILYFGYRGFQFFRH